jgi:hypothetical protein
MERECVYDRERDGKRVFVMKREGEIVSQRASVYVYLCA